MNIPTTFSPRSSSLEVSRRERFAGIFQESPIPARELVHSQLGVYLPRQELSRILAISEIYKNHVINSNGVIMEFGTCFGRTASLLTNLRGIFEPYNFTRKLVIFDTFEGLRGVTPEDGDDPGATDGNYDAGRDYDQHLAEVLAFHESEAPIPHLRKHEIVKGDASVQIVSYLRRHPETIVSLAYFDFDIYAPTKACLEALRPHLCRNSVLAFDELNCPEFPGETVALREVVGLSHCMLRRSPLTPWLSYTTCEHLSQLDK